MKGSCLPLKSERLAYLRESIRRNLDVKETVMRLHLGKGKIKCENLHLS
jgi:hypothetical protein